MEPLEVILALLVGIGLSAACGFRVFVPLLVMSIASYTGHLSLASNMQWIGSPFAIAFLGIATALEIGAYYVPWIDNALDTVASPAAVIAGSIATASMVTSMDPALQWSLAVIGGGGAAAATQAVTVVTRAASTMTTGGLGNPLVSTAEAGGSFLFSILLVLLPLAIGAALVVVGLVLVTRLLIRRRRQSRLAVATDVPIDVQ